MTVKINKELERELHVLDTARRLGRVLVRDMPNAAPLLTRLATVGYLRQIAAGMYRLTPDGQARHDAIAKELRAGTPAMVEVTLLVGHDGTARLSLDAVPPGRYRALLERLP